MDVQGKVLANGPAGQQAVKKTGGYGSRMVENLEKQGKPVDERMRRMADWMDSMDTGDDGQVYNLELYILNLNRKVMIEKN